MWLRSRQGHGSLPFGAQIALLLLPLVLCIVSISGSENNTTKAPTKVTSVGATSKLTGPSQTTEATKRITKKSVSNVASFVVITPSPSNEVGKKGPAGGGKLAERSLGVVKAPAEKANAKAAMTKSNAKPSHAPQQPAGQKRGAKSPSSPKPNAVTKPTGGESKKSTKEKTSVTTKAVGDKTTAKPKQTSKSNQETSAKPKDNKKVTTKKPKRMPTTSKPKVTGDKSAKKPHPVQKRSADDRMLENMAIPCYESVEGQMKSVLLGVSLMPTCHRSTSAPNPLPLPGPQPVYEVVSSLVGQTTPPSEEIPAVRIAAKSPDPGTIGIAPDDVKTQNSTLLPYYAKLYGQLYPVKNSKSLLKAYRNVESVQHEIPAAVPKIINSTEPLILPSPSPTIPTTPPVALTPHPLEGFVVPSTPLESFVVPSTRLEGFVVPSTPLEGFVVPSTLYPMPNTGLFTHAPTFAIYPTTEPNRDYAADHFTTEKYELLTPPNRDTKPRYKAVPISDFLQRVRSGVPPVTHRPPPMRSSTLRTLGAISKKEFYKVFMEPARRRKSLIAARDNPPLCPHCGQMFDHNHTHVHDFDFEKEKELHSSYVGLPSYIRGGKFEATTKGPVARLKAQLLMNHNRALSILPKFKDFYKILTPSPHSNDRRHSMGASSHHGPKYSHHIGLHGYRGIKQEFEPVKFQALKMTPVFSNDYGPNRIFDLPAQGIATPYPTLLNEEHGHHIQTRSRDVMIKRGSGQAWPVIDPLEPGRDQAAKPFNPADGQNLPPGLVQELLKLNLNELASKLGEAADGPMPNVATTPSLHHNTYPITPPPPSGSVPEISDMLGKMDLKSFLERYRPDLWKQIAIGNIPTVINLAEEKPPVIETTTLKSTTKRTTRATTRTTTRTTTTTTTTTKATPKSTAKPTTRAVTRAPTKAPTKLFTRMTTRATRGTAAATKKLTSSPLKKAHKPTTAKSTKTTTKKRLTAKPSRITTKRPKSTTRSNLRHKTSKKPGPRLKLKRVKQKKGMRRKSIDFEESGSYEDSRQVDGMEEQQDYVADDQPTMVVGMNTMSTEAAMTTLPSTTASTSTALTTMTSPSTFLSANVTELPTTTAMTTTIATTTTTTRTTTAPPTMSSTQPTTTATTTLRLTTTTTVARPMSSTTGKASMLSATSPSGEIIKFVVMTKPTVSNVTINETKPATDKTIPSTVSTTPKLSTIISKLSTTPKLSTTTTSSPTTKTTTSIKAISTAAKDMDKYKKSETTEVVAKPPAPTRIAPNSSVSESFEVLDSEEFFENDEKKRKMYYKSRSNKRNSREEDFDPPDKKIAIKKIKILNWKKRKMGKSLRAPDGASSEEDDEKRAKKKKHADDDSHRQLALLKKNSHKLQKVLAEASENDSPRRKKKKSKKPRKTKRKVRKTKKRKRSKSKRRSKRKDDHHGKEGPDSQHQTEKNWDIFDGSLYNTPSPFQAMDPLMGNFQLAASTPAALLNGMGIMNQETMPQPPSAYQYKVLEHSPQLDHKVPVPPRSKHGSGWQVQQPPDPRLLHLYPSKTHHRVDDHPCPYKTAAKAFSGVNPLPPNQYHPSLVSGQHKLARTYHQQVVPSGNTQAIVKQPKEAAVEPPTLKRVHETSGQLGLNEQQKSQPAPVPFDDSGYAKMSKLLDATVDTDLSYSGWPEEVADSFLSEDHHGAEDRSLDTELPQMRAPQRVNPVYFHRSYGPQLPQSFLSVNSRQRRHMPLWQPSPAKYSPRMAAASYQRVPVLRIGNKNYAVQHSNNIPG